MPSGIGYGDDAIDRLIELATDPMYDVPDPTNVGALTQGVPQPGGAAPTMDYRLNPSYAEGGLVTPNGPPAQAGLNPQGAGQQMSAQQMESEMQRMVQQNPEQILRIKSAIEQLIQSGELTMEQLNMAVQLATAAAQNPQLWPQLRAFAVQQGLAAEQEIPQEYDQGLVFVLLLAGRAVQMQGQGQAPMGGQQIPMSQGQPPQATMKTGGVVPDSRNADGSVAINAHDGEGVLHAGVMRAKGMDFLDKLNNSYNLDGTPKQANAKATA